MGITTHLRNEFDYDIVEEFLDHFQVMCLSMEPAIMHLSDALYYKTNIEELFRIFHNIKSASGFLKLEAMHKVSALVEQILEEMRNTSGPATEESINWLLAVSDHFNQWGSDLEYDRNVLSPINPYILHLPHRPEQ